MPQILEHIDAIARCKQRDVLYLTFFEDRDGRPVELDWQENETRQTVIAWLTANGHAWTPCGEIANERRIQGYRGSIYIDTPFDQADPAYQALIGFLEHPDGSLRLPQMRFWALTLRLAMKNAHHDDPGFWERWAEDF